MGITEQREREKERRRNEIFDAAEKVFFAKSIANATMDEVAEQAELSKGTLYLYFPIKQELYFGLTERALLKLKDMFSQAVQEQTSGIKQVRAIGETYYRFSRDYTDHFNTIAHWEVAELYMEDDSLRY